MQGEKYWGRAWSLVDGCTPVSEACDHCWLEAQNKRFKKWESGTVTPREDRLHIPLKTRKPTVFAVWSDLFHEAVPFSFIDVVFAAMAIATQHTFLVLTKRPERMVEWYEFKNLAWANEGMRGPERIRYQTYHHFGKDIDFSDWKWPLPNVWHGTTVENQEQANKRILHLLKVPGKKFLSIEPMLGPVDLGLDKTERIDAVILGGEIGRGARPMHPGWARSVRDQCQAAGVPFFFTQWGEWLPLNQTNPHTVCSDYWYWLSGNPSEAIIRVGKKSAGRILDGRTHDELAWLK